MSNEKSNEKAWYVFGCIYGDEKEILAIRWESEEGARIYAIDLYDRFCECEICKSFFTILDLDDDFTVFDGSWTIIKRRSGNDE